MFTPSTLAIVLIVGAALPLFDYLASRLRLTHSFDVAVSAWLVTVGGLLAFTIFVFNFETAFAAAALSVAIEGAIFLAPRKYFSNPWCYGHHSSY